MEKQERIFIYGGNCLGISLKDSFLYDYEYNLWETVNIKNSRALTGHSGAYSKMNNNVYIYGLINLLIKNFLTFK